ncbi:RNA polymerase sigma-70 factor [Parabacteroides sp. W1-Q-101]|uniref:RNA polymerase sigma-70 factor n=1 Tax=Parabacteroides segnis TaxID=2763058 RepID=A0ABR7E5I9_9BACT|nr:MULTISPECIES: RNA polymerase sigma-70 factor [Parabacteroides]MBC5644359.1 RNA polymerase sigma-70 factor [Parabacteroides segnis]MCM0714381.1 RNA polymerase sigma-70 factor [Parabacteroides sp. TA-V-105]MCM0718708.1 RNA polymerase sigma-70 factor [Parabacteroides sp. W1-Q-101]
MDNQTLILALKNGSEEAFTSLYHKYCDKVYKFCRLYYTNDSTTEEVVQEVFIKLWDIRSYVNENENLEGLLFIITRNMIFSNSKKNFNETFYKMSILAAYDKAYDIEEELQAKDLQIYIERLVNELPPRQKEVFYLSRHEQLSYKEIAERLDITPKTVERHINEALKYLKKNIYFLQLFLAV